MKRNLSVMRRVLLVEAEAPFRRSLEKCLSKAGYRTLACASGSDALRLASENPIDLAIVEYHLPDGNGAELARKLKSSHVVARVVLISFYDLDFISCDVLDAVDGFLKKPFDLIDFERMLSRVWEDRVLVAVPRSKLGGADIPASTLKEGTL
ncbi:Response regulator receiver domain-containing protein [Desulfacinum hydrothermale DSM 13146]|uniref:Response regulator receiver domain-containing protein n=1 Tax=Desulfacinum hydrothermale DSM 13146 TaxID=1121390 RepID=A0A1W1XTE5_9BACT|nr:response regulator [Desulfacinum hydrothermale]SMC27233.1 Response regulator receiver domain-containing protein [Desulfacinum hydrothermale DSM 13146]